MRLGRPSVERRAGFQHAPYVIEIVKSGKVLFDVAHLLAQRCDVEIEFLQGGARRQCFELLIPVRAPERCLDAMDSPVKLSYLVFQDLVVVRQPRFADPVGRVLVDALQLKL